MSVILISRTHYPGDVEDTLEVIINDRKYRYLSDTTVADKFEEMLKYDIGGFKALNFLKRRSECKGEIKVK